jgi:hypothetical protein
MHHVTISSILYQQLILFIIDVNYIRSMISSTDLPIFENRYITSYIRVLLVWLTIQRHKVGK